MRTHLSSNYDCAASATNGPRMGTPPTPLKRGMVYIRVNREIKKGTEEVSISLASQGKFKVLEDQKLNELNRLKTTSQ